jgi:hypothetical protein
MGDSLDQGVDLADATGFFYHEQVIATGTRCWSIPGGPARAGAAGNDSRR